MRRRFHPANDLSTLLLARAHVSYVPIHIVDECRIVFILTSGGPARSTETIVYRIYTEAFGNGKLGYASALSYVLLIMTLIVGLIQLYTNNKHEKEEIA